MSIAVLDKASPTVPSPSPSRRNMFAGAASVAVSVASVSAIGSTAQAQASRTAGHKPRGLTDADIFNFALNLEFLETEYYLRGVTGQGLSQSDTGSASGEVTGGRKVQFRTPMVERFMQNIGRNEARHVQFLRSTLESSAIARPRIDFTAGFAGVAEAAGLGADFDPFADEVSFMLGSYLFEDVGVTAYKGAAPFIRNKDYLQAAAGIHAMEAYHVGVVRSSLYRLGPAVRDQARKISDLRDLVDGPLDLDQPIELNGRANIVPTDSGGVTFSRTPQEVLNIVYGQAGAGIMSGGFFPDGLNGKVHVT